MQRKSLNAAIAILIGVSFNSNARVIDFEIQFTGVDWVYDPSQSYSNIGTDTSIPLFNSNPNTDNTSDSDAQDGKSVVDGVDMNFATIRDKGGPMNGADTSLGVNDGGGGGSTGVAGDGFADATFGDVTYAEELASVTVSFNGTEKVYVATEQPLYLDFRLVLGVVDSNTQTGDDLKDALNDKIQIQNQPNDSSERYAIIEEYSFIDLLTQIGPGEEDDFGLGIDLADGENASIRVIDGDENEESNQTVLSVTTTVSGVLFNESANNLPWFDVSDEDSIRYTINFTTDSVNPDWSSIVTGSGGGSLTGKAIDVSEPATLSVFTLALTGLGALSRRRKKSNNTN